MLTGAQSFAEVLGEELGEAGEPPTLSLTVTETQGTVTIGSGEEFTLQAGIDPWQDEDTRTFYTSLPDLKVFMPNYQLKEVGITNIFFLSTSKRLFLIAFKKKSLKLVTQSNII